MSIVTDNPQSHESDENVRSYWHEHDHSYVRDENKPKANAKAKVKPAGQCNEVIFPDEMTVTDIPHCHHCTERMSNFEKDRKTIEENYKSLEQKYKMLEENYNILETKYKSVSKLWKPDQVKRMENPGSHCQWSYPTIMEALQCYSMFGSTGYKYFVQVLKFPYPPLRTLQWHLAKIEFQPGPPPEDLLTMLRHKVPTLHPKERFVSMCCDEMSIQARKEFDLTTQSFVGQPTMPPSKKLIAKRAKQGIYQHDFLATHAMNLMIGGITSRFRQLVAYQFTDNSVDVKEYAKWILNAIQSITDTGLRVVSLSMDMASDNQGL